MDAVEITGYTFEPPSQLEGLDSIVIANGQRIYDKLPVIAKLSCQTLRLEREYHSIMQFYNLPEARTMLCEPLEKIVLPNGWVAVIFVRYGKNRLEALQPITTQTPASDSISFASHPPLSLDDFFDFAIQACNCLEIIHKNQIVHGEIKPAAFIWPENDSLKIWNFGSGVRSLETNLTSEGWRKTVHRTSASNLWQILIYMSPEQTGRTTFQPDHRTDLYSLGITFFVILTQSLPFAYNSPMEIVHSVLNRQIPNVHSFREDVPPICSQIIQKLTHKSPDKRYTSAHGLREDLKECQKQLKAHGNPQTVTPFRLGTSDIACVFTLPAGCFGRENEMEIINGIIRRAAYVCNLERRRRLQGSTSSLLVPLGDSIHSTSSSSCSSISSSTPTNTTTTITDYIQPRPSTSARTRTTLTHWKKPTEVVAIYGVSGVGKSTLIRCMQETAHEYGYVAVAKFDVRQPTPYGCLLRCMNIFLRHILAEPPAETEAFSEMLKQHLWPQDNQPAISLPDLLLDNVPELSVILGDYCPVERDSEADISGGEIKARFHSAFIAIFQVMVNFKFITLFLEDLHQADEASIELLESLITARLNVLVIVSYRQGELSESALRLVCNDDSLVTNVELKNLDQDALMEYVRTAMHRHKDLDTQLLGPLVEFIYRKTNGNPFYVGQLLVALEKKGLLYFTWEQRRWEYNLDGIKKAVVHGPSLETDKDHDIDNEFLVQRLNELPPDGRTFLKWASFIGNSFSYEAVHYLMTAPAEKDSQSLLMVSSDDILARRRPCDAINGLQSALQQGFIQPSSNDEFRFCHDRYSQAAMALVRPERHDWMHLRIASYFINRPCADAFWVADHIQAAITLIQRYDAKHKHRAALTRAGNQAYKSGAHNIAFSYFASARDLLAPEPWVDGPDSEYQETLHIYIRLAEISWFMGYSMTLDLLKTILAHAKTATDRAAAYRIQHRYSWVHGEHQGKALILLECLQELGVEQIKLDLSDEALKELYDNTWMAVTTLGIDKISELPACNSHLVRTRLSILEELCLWAFQRNEVKTVLIVGSRLILKTIRCGISPTTGVGFVFFGIASMHLFKAYEFGQQMGEVGLGLCKKFGGNSELATANYLYGTFLSSWKNHYRAALPMFRQALKQSLLSGDRLYAIFSHIQIVMGMLLSSHPLEDTLKEAQLCAEQAALAHRPGSTPLYITTVIRAIRAFQGKTMLTEDRLFDDDTFKEEAFVAEMSEYGHTSGLPMYWYFAIKLITLTVYGFDEAAIKIGDKYAQLSVIQPSFRHTHLMLFCHTVSMLRLKRKDKNSSDFDALIQRNRDTLAEWAHQSPINLAMFVSLIDAELASFSDDRKTAQDLYELAIRQAKEGDWGSEINIMYELAGEYYIRAGLGQIGMMLIEKAVAGWQLRGCHGMSQYLVKRHGLLADYDNMVAARDVEVQTEPLHMSTPRQSSFDDLSFVATCAEKSVDEHATPEEMLMTLDMVDLVSILKSSQIISSEMNFELLMEQMLGIILENSGAASGVIIIKENSSFYVMGCGSQSKGCEIFKTPQPLSEDNDSLMTRVAHYVLHAQESMLICDIQRDPHFSDFATTPVSIICTPITHKSAVVGCIYIESAVGSLTSRHEIVMRLLSQQIGISVTNALLFKSIQKVTYANVKMIESQKAALEEARQSKEAALRAMKLKADFLANMSHELRTPFSGFYGMISLLSETSLDAEQTDIVYTAKESCEMLLRIIDDLLNFSKLEAGKVVLDLGPMVVKEVIADTIEILSSLAARKGLELAYIVDADVPDTVICDSSRLRQILTNLLGNAIKFTHQGGVVIKCMIDDAESQDDSIHLKFEVLDTGIGINPEQQRNLFEPFSQVDGSTTRMYGGTGLGLSICLQLVRLMMGTICVESEPGQGSNFWFTVNVSQASETPKNSSDCAAMAALYSKRSLLLATHHDPTSYMLQSLLPEFKVKRTSDVQHAIALALKEHHDILLLDVPPIPNSFIAHQLQSIDDDPECDLHIIVLYTPATEGHKVAAEATNSASERRGRIVKMAKPARRSKLLKLIEQVIDHPRQSPQPTRKSPLSGYKMSDYFQSNELAYFLQRPVLIAEDNMVAQKLLRKQLEKMGFKVESANNGEEAVQLWEQRPPNYFCIGFFDHHMPKCDGVEATKRIRHSETMAEAEGTTRGRLSIIALTADVQTSARDVCFGAGMDGYLTKPLIPKELSIILQQLYPRSELESEVKELS
ncbi:Serine/threonine kinase hybrid HK [Phycomyces blakesleeanus]|uniref:Serine/threonine kinase hybrid HK n=1 Tax=Phycomyces blakesleeanus TaxID=4837 RepID=A0ABR3AUE8_PHYBL